MSDFLSTSDVSNVFSAAGVTAESPSPGESDKGIAVVRLERSALLERMVLEGRSSVVLPANPVVVLSASPGHADVATDNSKIERVVKKRALVAACASGNYQRAKELIDAGAEVTGDLMSKVICSEFEFETELVELLLSSGVDVDYRQYDMTLLQYALDLINPSFTNIQTIGLLLRKGADIFDSEGVCLLDLPMMNAVENGDFALIEALLEADLEPTLRRQILSNAFDLAPLRANEEEATRMMEFLLSKGADVNYECRDFGSMLHSACGFDWNHPDACWKPNPLQVRFLCEHGADVDAVTEENGRTALHILCGDHFHSDDDDEDEFMRDVVECVKILLDHGADVDAVDDVGDVPFVLAVEYDKDEVVDLLLDHHVSRLAHFE